MVSTLLAPWRTSRTWRALGHLSLSIGIGIGTFTAAVTLLALTLGLAITFPFAIATGWLLFVGARAFGVVERTRVAALLDTELGDPHPPLPSGFFRRLWARVTTVSRWKEIAYLVVLFPLGLFSATVALTLWATAAALVLLPTYVGRLPDQTVALWGDLTVGSGWVALLTLLGLVLFALVAPWATLGLASLERGVARALIGPSEAAVVAAAEAAAEQAEAGRAAALGSAEAERRRIERDLHDGAQARLVALAADLGMAEERFDRDPEGARALLVGAKDEAKAALAELRDLVRGMHPSVMEDRGLEAALSSVVARVPVPVRLEVDVAERPSPAVESAAYFVVAEALTNVTRHSGATRATATIARRGDRLAIEVTDDGVGGADPDLGTGLRGLEERVHGLSGWVQVLSPEGGPTTVLVELPCAS